MSKLKTESVWSWAPLLSSEWHASMCVADCVARLSFVPRDGEVGATATGSCDVVSDQKCARRCALVSGVAGFRCCSVLAVAGQTGFETVQHFVPESYF